MNNNRLFFKWKKIGWKMIQEFLWQIQHRIYKAEKENNKSLVLQLQILLARSYSCKLYALSRLEKENAFFLPYILQNKKIQSANNLWILSQLQNKSKVLKPNNIDSFFTSKLIAFTNKKKQISMDKKINVLQLHINIQLCMCFILINSQWEAHFENWCVGLRLGRSYYDTITSITQNLITIPKYLLHTKMKNKVNDKQQMRSSFLINDLYKKTMFNNLNTVLTFFHYQPVQYNQYSLFHEKNRIEKRALQWFLYKKLKKHDSLYYCNTILINKNLQQNETQKLLLKKKYYETIQGFLMNVLNYGIQTIMQKSIIQIKTDFILFFCFEFYKKNVFKKNIENKTKNLIEKNQIKYFRKLLCYKYVIDDKTLSSAKSMSHCSYIDGCNNMQCNLKTRKKQNIETIIDYYYFWKKNTNFSFFERKHLKLLCCSDLIYICKKPDKNKINQNYFIQSMSYFMTDNFQLEINKQIQCYLTTEKVISYFKQKPIKSQAVIKWLTKKKKIQAFHLLIHKIGDKIQSYFLYDSLFFVLHHDQIIMIYSDLVILQYYQNILKNILYDKGIDNEVQLVDQCKYEAQMKRNIQNQTNTTMCYGLKSEQKKSSIDFKHIDFLGFYISQTFSLFVCNKIQPTCSVYFDFNAQTKVHAKIKDVWKKKFEAQIHITVRKEKIIKKKKTNKQIQTKFLKNPHNLNPFSSPTTLLPNSFLGLVFTKDILLLQNQLKKQNKVVSQIDFLSNKSALKKTSQTSLFKPTCLKTHILVNKCNLQEHLKQIRQIIKQFKARDQLSLIIKLCPIIRGWCSYYSIVNNSKVLSYCDYLTFKMLWRWACRRHTKKSRQWIKMNYFHQFNGKNWVFAFYNKQQSCFICLPNHSDTTLLKHQTIIEDESPYNNNHQYWLERNEPKNFIN
jgi:hypothetical protein